MSDLIGQPDEQIRDDTYQIETASLQTVGAEVVPDELIRDLLTREWISTQVAPKPLIIIQDEIVQASLKNQDALIISVENYQEQYTGHRQEFVDIEVPLTIQIKTIVSRGRMWSLMAEARRVCYRWMLALQPFHVIYFDGFQPDYIGQNNYSGVMRIRLSAGAVPAFLRHVTGQEAPNTEPDQFIGGP